MSNNNEIIQHIENAPLRVMYYAYNLDNDPIVQADVALVSVSVYDTSESEEPTYEDEPTISEVIFDTLQTDSRWTKDSTGYNLAVVIPGTAFPTGDKTYQIEVNVTDTEDNVYPMTPVRVYTRNLYSL